MNISTFLIFVVFLFSSHSFAIERTGPAVLPWEKINPSENAQELSIKYVFESVEKHFPLADVAKKQVQYAEGQETAARGAFDFRLVSQFGLLTETYEQQTLETLLSRQIDGTPLELYGGWSRGTGNFRPYEGKLLTGSGGEFKGGLKLPLLRNFLHDPARTNVSVARSLLNYEKQISKFKILDLKRAASDRYWEWVGSYFQLEAIYKLYQLAHERFEQVKKRVKAGGSASIEIVEAERTIVQRKSQLIEAERNYQKNALQLSLYCRDESGKPLKMILFPKKMNPNDFLLEQNESLKSIEDSINLAKEQRGDLKAIQYQLQAAEQEYLLSKNSLLPKLDAQVEYAVNNGAPKSGEKELRGILTLTFPLENREARGKYISAKTKIDQITQSKYFLDDQISQEVVNFQSAIKASFENAKVMLQDQELSEKLAQAERKRFQEGLSTLLTVNLREQSANDSALKSINALIDFQKIRVLYQVSLGLDPT